MGLTRSKILVLALTDLFQEPARFEKTNAVASIEWLNKLNEYTK